MAIYTSNIHWKYFTGHNEWNGPRDNGMAIIGGFRKRVNNLQPGAIGREYVDADDDQN